MRFFVHFATGFTAISSRLRTLARTAALSAILASSSQAGVAGLLHSNPPGGFPAPPEYDGSDFSVCLSEARDIYITYDYCPYGLEECGPYGTCGANPYRMTHTLLRDGVPIATRTFQGSAPWANLFFASQLITPGTYHATVTLEKRKWNCLKWVTVETVTSNQFVVDNAATVAQASIDGKRGGEMARICPSAPIMLRTSSMTDCTSGYFVSVMKSDPWWGSTGPECMRWLTAADYASYGPISNFDVRGFFASFGQSFMPGQYYRVKLAVGPVWSETTILVYMQPDCGRVVVEGDIIGSAMWTADNVYDLRGAVYVRPGATLTIEAGTVIASETGMGGTLIITAGSQIMALGTKEAPIIFTSTSDRETWVGGDPRTGTWREAAAEWGGLVVMGRGFISENAAAMPGNVSTCDPYNVADMEGLTNGPTTDRYGGGDDNDDSGTLSFVSIRYGGRVIGLANELNALSLGGIGRDTDIHNVDIMNSIDDGIEIWGGTVNIKYFNVWNVGDDSFDVDQGWRGKAQFGLLVQGYSAQSFSGSGVGDNLFELDGAEDGDYQPVTTSTIYNVTAIGQPSSGDHATAWRSNARVQFRNSIFMDLGERLVGFDNTDGAPDFHLGYGANGTLSWAATWSADYNAVPAHANDCGAGMYTVQTSGKLAEIKDSVFFNNNFGTAYTESTARGVHAPSNNNVTASAANSPIQFIQRGSDVVFHGLTLKPVIKLDPHPANDALTSFASAPHDGFFTSAAYRGAFAPNTGPVNISRNWCLGWTAADAFGFFKRNGKPVRN